MEPCANTKKPIFHLEIVKLLFGSRTLSDFALSLLENFINLANDIVHGYA
jgi:hypothetical protein